MKGEMQKVVEGVAAEGGVWFCDVGWFGGAAVVPSSFGEGFGDAVKDALGRVLARSPRRSRCKHAGHSRLDDLAAINPGTFHQYYLQNRIIIGQIII
ncbi:hypothetical protein [Rubneribacter sp.]